MKLLVSYNGEFTFFNVPDDVISRSAMKDENSNSFALMQEHTNEVVSRSKK